ncbi:outer membrane beta-barrel domain-containing protein [Litoribrevibacter euphylliae]|uniref:Outer membrane beta-barrel domain-containing protein n=1 Tax=Litoribrevibacter euphylliae TaxID=1834034 RepID=A0ABV7HIB1_9GAMM
MSELRVGLAPLTKAVLLTCFMAFSATSLWVGNASAEEANDEAASDKSSDSTDWLYKPDMSEEDVDVPAIDTENFEISVFAGLISMEDFGSESFTGARIAYHPLDFLFVEASWAESEINDDNYRRFGVPLFENASEDVEFFDASVGLQLMPGEVFIGKWAFPSSLYLIGGIGSTSILDEDLETYNLGVGLRVLATDWWAFRVEARDYYFESDLLGEAENKHNLAVSIGTGVFF